MKRLALVSPHTLLHWLLPQAEYLQEMPLKLDLTEFDVDLLLKIKEQGQEMLLHLEFQTANDRSMAERTLRYHVLARIEHKLPVLSIVIYLFQDGKAPETSLLWRTPTGHEVLHFSFLDIKLWEMSAKTLEQMDNRGLLALISLTKDGAQRGPVTQMLTTLYERPEDADLLLVGYNLAMLAFRKRNQDDMTWLEKEFAYMQERFEESPFYQTILERGHKKGLEEGLEEGRKEAREEMLEMLRRSLLNTIEDRYPNSDLAQLASEVTTHQSVRDNLPNLLMQIGLTRSPQEVRVLLLASDTEQIQH